MNRILGISICALLSLTACSAVTGAPAAVAPAPAPSSDIGTSVWANRYPVEYDQWSNSVHGLAYLEGNTDAPGCTDCHGDPETEDISAPAFRLEIPSRCARCHADAAVMTKYGIATDVYETYQADYHGTTIEYYRATDMNAVRYEAVCSDCHGSHDIYGQQDSKSPVSTANLLTTCQKCHTRAESNVINASMGHFRTSQDVSLLVYIAKRIYLILIPVVIGGMLAFIGLDIWHRVRRKTKGQAS